MRIGIDFDNTVINYENVFYRYGVMNNLVPGNIEKDKTVIRDYIRKKFGDKYWTELQILVYGEKISEAKVEDGFEKFVKKCRDENIPVFVISHKTEYDALGMGVNLREKAFSWMEENNFFSKDNLGFKREDICFAERKSEKIERIKGLSCTHFIDDLIDIFIDKNFPEDVMKIYYAKNGVDSDFNLKNFYIFKNWSEIYDYFFGGK